MAATTPATSRRGRFDHTANALTMAHFGAKSEVARRCFEIDGSARHRLSGGIDLELHGMACLARSGGNIRRRDLLRMRDVIAELLACVREASRDGGVCRIIDIDIGP